MLGLCESTVQGVLVKDSGNKLSEGRAVGTGLNYCLEFRVFFIWARSRNH